MHLEQKNSVKIMKEDSNSKYILQKKRGRERASNI